MIYSWIELSKQIEAKLKEYSFVGKPQELYTPIEYTMSLGGKRIRPTLCLLGAQLFGGEINKSIDLALGIEVFHNFTLVHDDIMDEAPLRRGQATVHKKWDRDRAILSGDVMLVKAYEFICQSQSDQISKILSLFNKTAIEVCEGQQFDMNFEQRNDVSLQEYIEMIRLKTAVLLACSLEVGALSTGAQEKEAALIYEFGEKIGIAFQIQDDYLDAYAKPEDFGKRVGGDIISNKKTFLLLAALENADSAQKEKLNHLLNLKLGNGLSSEEEEEKIEGVLNLYYELDISSLTKKAMNSYYQKAMEALDEIKVGFEFKKPLIDLAEQLMNRKN